MKKTLYFLPLFAALTFSSCSNDMPSENENNWKEGEPGYIAVNIVQPKSTGTRADGDFENGSSDENGASSALFYIFDSSDKLVTMDNNPQTINLEATNGTTTTPAVEQIYKAVLVINGAKSISPGLKLVSVLNAPAGLASENITDIAALKAKVADYSISDANKFIMTNSVYKNGNEEVLGAVVTDANIATTPQGALDKPVEIYVERVVAKVRIQGSNDFTDKGATVIVDGAEKKLNIKITGVEIANIAQKSYLFKNINGISYTWAWDLTNKRSYWETVPTAPGFDNKKYSEIANNANFDIKAASLTDYIQPNTSGQKTSVLVTAQLLDGTTPFEFVFVRGRYCTATNGLAVIAKYVADKGYWKKDGTGYIQLATTDFAWCEAAETPAYLKDYEAVAKVNASVKDIYKKNGENYTPVEASEINALLAGTETNPTEIAARYFKDGKCYYYVPIDQSPVAGAAAGTYEGVVRNHIYDLTLNSIEGIGTPVFDPEKVIIPEKPDDSKLYYLGARINVLSWRLVSQGVDFKQ